MARRPPSGPVGNAPRDVRDDFIGAPPEPITAGEPPRWPPKPKRITKNTFHAKVSGGTLPKRPDRRPHYRKGGWVSGYAAGGSVPKSEQKEDKREVLPGAQKNDPMSPQNLRGQPVKHEDVKARGYKSGGVLSAKQRQSLPKSSFALPGKGEGPKGAGAGSYPIPDESHARNALARVSQHGSSEQKAKVRAKVKAKFPGIGQK